MSRDSSAGPGRTGTEGARILLDTAVEPTKALMSWRGDAWHDLPASSNAVRLDGPGTRGNAHDEYVWLPRIDSDSFRCSFRLELHVEPQPGHPRDVGRHAGIALGVSQAYADGRWERAPRRSMTDGVWMGWWKGGAQGLQLNTFGEWAELKCRAELGLEPSLEPEEWLVEAAGTSLKVSIAGVPVCDVILPRPLDGFLGFWRARSEHAVTVHNLRVEQPGELLLTCHACREGPEALTVDCTSMGGESLTLVRAAPTEGIEELRAKILAGLGEGYRRLRLLHPDGRLLEAASFPDVAALLSERAEAAGHAAPSDGGSRA